MLLYPILNLFPYFKKLDLNKKSGIIKAGRGIVKKRLGTFQTITTLYACGKKGVRGILKIRQGVIKHDAKLGFRGVLDLLGSAGLALLLAPEAMMAGAILSFGVSAVENIQAFRESQELSHHEKWDKLLKAGISASAILFFLPGGTWVGSFLVGGLTAVRKVFAKSLPQAPMLSAGSEG